MAPDECCQTIPSSWLDQPISESTCFWVHLRELSAHALQLLRSIGGVHRGCSLLLISWLLVDTETQHLRHLHQDLVCLAEALE